VPVPTSLYIEAADPPERRCNYENKITWSFVYENSILQVKLLLHNTVDRFMDKMQEDKIGFELYIIKHSADVICSLFHCGKLTVSGEC